ncbi:glycerophosphodiester phosphodiesterase family protein [Pukyongiella litopenaei]|uniref:Phosphodiesterase n=1 Tax=Pukyongiella litopenaei TaxID=2605946 RepID=A0A2S0MSM5_9RHOB|nr:glycerophosphodiester phosphodiesterase family protein [Pukyongiella litopenaei]AVO38866.1 phosphodiesterase [Pukyongiella litopenaei]
MTVPPLPQDFLRLPVAHRALHDTAQGRPENSRAAIRAAIEAGYAIEIDLQPSADGVPLVFHDYDLSRLTEARGPVRDLTAAEAGRVPLGHGDGEGIPTLAEVLDLVAGRVPLLVEIKDQDGALGPDVGPLEAATAAALAGYAGPVAVMSFNPHSVAEMARLAPDLPRGLVTDRFEAADWPVPADRRAALREIPDFDRVGAAFISHQAKDLGRGRVQDLRRAGVPVLCWTIRSPQAEADARRLADNVTFERYLAALPA